MIDIKFIEKENRAVAYDNKIEIGECEFEELEDTWTRNCKSISEMCY